MVIIGNSSIHSKSSKCNCDKCLDVLLKSSFQAGKNVSLTALSKDEIVGAPINEKRSQLSSVEIVSDEDVDFSNSPCDVFSLKNLHDSIMKEKYHDYDTHNPCIDFNKNNLTVNYLLTKHTKSGKPLTPTNKEYHKKNFPNQHCNIKNKDRLHEHVSNLQNSRPELNEKFEEALPNTKIKDIINKGSIPQKIESSFNSEELKKQYFFDDYLDFNPPDFACTNQPRPQNRVDGMDTNFQESIEDLESRYPIYSHRDVCYMEPKWCSPFCQGIPLRNDRYGILENNNVNSFHEDDYYFPEHTDFLRRNCIPNHKVSYYDSENKTPTRNNIKKNKPHLKKKRQFNCCKSTKVDQEELFTEKKTQDQFFQSPSAMVQPNFKNICCKCAPSRSSTPMRDYTPNLIPNEKIHSDSHLKYHWHCPFSPFAEESKMKSTKPKPIMKSVACDCENSLGNMVDIGRNITIQIMPNCCQASKTCIVPKHSPQKTKSVEKLAYPCKKCSLKRDNEYEPYNEFMKTSFNCNEQDLCQVFNLKEKPFSRWWSYNRKTKKCKLPCERIHDQAKSYEEECQLMANSNCQRVLPVKPAYINKNNVRSFNHLKKEFKNLFATPCPSSSLTCPDACMNKVGVPSLPLYSIPNLAPTTTNQCCQYDPDCDKSDKTNDSLKYILLECLQYLKKDLASENHDEVVEEDCCCCQTNSNCCCQSETTFCCQTHCTCCCQNGNNCCCCRRTPRHCKPQEIISPKVDVKKTKSCRCRSVEAKQSLKHCGTIVSNQCLRCVETVCTNTEVCQKPLKPVKKKLICCKHKCCCCCNKTKNQCCDRCYRSESTTCCKCIEKTCKCQHFVYCCQCDTTSPILEGPDIKYEKTEENTLEKYIELLTAKIKDVVSKETISSIPKDSSNDKISKRLKTNEKSTDTNSLLAPTSQSKDVVIKSITLDLCNLGEKEFSKFGVPSRQYPWSKNSFFSAMPHEIYRFLGVEEFYNPLLEKAYDDPTPCMTPEILHDEKQNTINKKQSGTDIKESCMLNKKYLSAISRALFETERRDYINKSDFLMTIKGQDTLFEDRRHVEINIEEKDEKIQLSSDQECSINIHTVKKEIDKTQKSTDTNCSPQNDGKLKNNCESKNTSKSISKTSRTKVFPSISKKFSNIPKTSSNTLKSSSHIDMSYTPKPFTTRTGLMSFIPSFRESYKAPTQVKKNKKSPALLKTIEMKEKITKTQSELKGNKLSNDLNQSQENESTSKAEVMKNFESNENKQMVMGREKAYIKETSTSKDLNALKILDEKKTHINEPFDSSTFNTEIHDIYKKCFETPNMQTEEVTAFHFGNSRFINSLQDNSQVSRNVNIINKKCNSTILNINKDELYSEAV